MVPQIWACANNEQLLSLDWHTRDGHRGRSIRCYVNRWLAHGVATTKKNDGRPLAGRPSHGLAGTSLVRTCSELANHVDGKGPLVSVQAVVEWHETEAVDSVEGIVADFGTDRQIGGWLPVGAH